MMRCAACRLAVGFGAVLVALRSRDGLQVAHILRRAPRPVCNGSGAPHLAQERMSTHQCQLFAAATVAALLVATPMGQAPVLRPVRSTQRPRDDVVDGRAFAGASRARLERYVDPALADATLVAVALDEVLDERLTPLCGAKRTSDRNWGNEGYARTRPASW